MALDVVVTPTGCALWRMLYETVGRSEEVLGVTIEDGVTRG
jgi:hypothetical protein